MGGLRDTCATRTREGGRELVGGRGKEREKDVLLETAFDDTSLTINYSYITKYFIFLFSFFTKFIKLRIELWQSLNKLFSGRDVGQCGRNESFGG